MPFQECILLVKVRENPVECAHEIIEKDFPTNLLMLQLRHHLIVIFLVGVWQLHVGPRCILDTKKKQLY